MENKRSAGKKLLLGSGKLIRYLIISVGIFFLLVFILFYLSLNKCEYIPSVQAPPSSATLGKIDGVFAYVTPTQRASEADQSWNCNLLRFYPNGDVMEILVLLKTPNVTESWALISGCFNREKQPTLVNKYYVQDNKIWFRTQSSLLSQDYVPKIDWWGTFNDQNMILNSYNHRAGLGLTNVKYIRVQVAKNDLK